MCRDGKTLVLVLGLFYTFSCNNDITIGPGTTSTLHTVGGVVSGITSADTVVLLNNGSDSVTVTGSSAIATDVPFTFPGKLSKGDAFSVTVQTQPGSKTCVVGANSGTVVDSNISTVKVNCSSISYLVGGSVAGLVVTGTGLTLQNSINGGATVENTVVSAATYNFPTSLTSGQTYSVSILSQPTNPSQNCTMDVPANSAGTATADVTNVNLTCLTNKFIISGNITLAAGTLDLQMTSTTGGVPNPVQNLTALPAGAFAFTPVDDLSTYTLTLTPPAGYGCVFVNGNDVGSFAGSDITTVDINCTPTGTYTIGGNVNLLANKATLQMQLSKNGTPVEDRIITGTGTSPIGFTFTPGFATGDTYAIAITNPSFPSQVCTVNAGGDPGSGTIATANLTNLIIDCVTNNFSVLFDVTGLGGADTITVTNNGVAFAGGPVGNSIGNTFTAQADGSLYNIQVSSAPVGVTCTVTGGVAYLLGVNATVPINCVYATVYNVGVQVAGLNVTAGTGLSLRLNGNAGDLQSFTGNVAVTSNFATTFVDGDVYYIEITGQPDRLSGNSIDQVCTLPANSSGSIVAASGSVASVITCATVSYSVTGTASGLSVGETLTLTDSTTGQSVILTSAASAYGFTNVITDGTSHNLILTGFPLGKDCYFNTPGTPTFVATAAGADLIENITCSGAGITTASVSATVSGLTSAGLKLTNTTAGPVTEVLTFNASGTQIFTAQPAGSGYAVTITAQPAGQTCFIASTPPSSGTISNPAVNVSLMVLCIATPVCGNSVVELGESCDVGGVTDTAACNARSCQTNFCGDGYLNTVAGEACDDGNSIAGDGCTSCAIDACRTFFTYDDGEWATYFGAATANDTYADAVKTPLYGKYSGNLIDEYWNDYLIHNMCAGNYYVWVRALDHPLNNGSDKSYGFWDFAGGVDTTATSDILLVDTFGWQRSAAVPLTAGSHRWRFGSMVDGGFTTVSWDEFIITTDALYTPPAGLAVTPTDYVVKEGFENDLSAWIDVSGGAATGTIVSTTAAVGNKSLALTGAFTPSTHFKGLQLNTHIGYPSYISFRVQCPIIATGAVGYVVLYSSNNNQATWFFCQHNGTDYRLRTATQGGTVIVSGPLVAAGTWYKVDYRNIDYAAQTFDFYIDNNLIQAGLSFQGNAIDVQTIHLYNFTNGFTSYYDEIILK